MSERIKTLVKRIADTRPVQTARRQALFSELRALRGDLDERSAPDQARGLDAALLLMEFMSRSDDVATAETLQIVASLVGMIDEHSVRAASAPAPLPARREAPRQGEAEVAEHPDLRLTQEFLLGSILVQAGVVSPESLSRALQLNASSGRALGQCLIQLGAATSEQIESAITYQDRMREEERATHATQPREVRSGERSGLRLTPKQKGFAQSLHSQVLGEVLIRLGAITREQLEKALQLQRAASLHVGEALVESGATGWDQVKRALEVQRQLRRAV